MSRNLKQVRLNLDLSRPDERALYEAYERMRDERQWQPTAIMALKIILSLRDYGDYGPLLAAFPFLRLGIQEMPPSHIPPQAVEYDGPGFEIGEASDDDIAGNLDSTFGSLFDDEEI